MCKISHPCMDTYAYMHVCSRTPMAYHLNHVPQVDGLGPRHGRRSVVVDKLVEGVEFHHPEEVLASSIAKHLEMLYSITEPTMWSDGKRRVVIC